MHNQNVLKLLFIINPVSGGKEKQDWEASIRQYFIQRPEAIEFYVLTGNNDKTSVQHHIERAKPNRVIAVGGDGTVKLLAGLVMETQLPLGILPAGSANGMAKELKIPLEIEPALKVIVEGECRKIDIIKINQEEISIHLSDIGLNAMLVKSFESSNKRGMWGYGKAVFKTFWKKQLMQITIKTDKQEVKRNAYMVVIANAQTYGTGAIINPNGKLDDGLFEVIIVRKINLFELFKMLVTHKPFDESCIEVFQTIDLEMTTKRKTYFQVDGEYLGKINSINARILPQSITVMQPLKTEKELA